MTLHRILLTLFASLSVGASIAGGAEPAMLPLDLKGEVAPGHEIAVRYPDGPKGWYPRGYRRENDGTADWRGYYGVQLDVELKDEQPIELTVMLRIPPEPARAALVQETKATTSVVGAGRHQVTLPWSAFDFNQVQPAFLKFVKELHVAAKGGSVTVTGARVVRGAKVALTADVLGKSGASDADVTYVAHVFNCTDAPQSVALAFERYGWEAMRSSVEPKSVQLAAGASAEVTVRVHVSPRVAAGGHETQVLKAIANGDGATAAKLTFVTAAELPHPYILHMPARWQEVREKVAKFDWAKKAQAEYIDKAAKWEVPEVAKAPKNLTGVDEMGPYLFQTTVENGLMAAGISYQLTGETKYAAKVRTFLLRLSDPRDGYPTTLRGCNQSLVQEGHFFQHIAMAYDMALPSGLFTAEEKAQIERTFRLLIETMDFETSEGAINNWNLSELSGAMYCALAMQDLSTAERFFRGPGGAVDQLAHGVLDDGWWYECAISYNVWCTTEFTQIALAMEPWGVNFRDMAVPVGYSKNYSLRAFDATDGLYGMSFQKWGPVTHNFVNIKRMWDALPPFVDYRGVMFGVNDAFERRVGGEVFDIAYSVYRDPRYAAMVKLGGTRDLLYGVGELPAETPKLGTESAYADNVGVAMLRSKSEGREARERIQAVLHYGTHGGFHGHFDRTDLLHLSRYGRSFFNPEMIWYSYAPFMYKFYVQNSTSKNMVVVDRKMQEPVESKRLLWHTGNLFQATAVETNARWSTPPYGGMQYPEQGYKSLQDKSWGEGRFLPKPDPEPEYGSVTQFTEPILQRRVMIVTDDYVVLADYLKGDREHTFESLLQMKGFKGIQAAEKKLIRHDAQWDANPILDAQFVTDCDWFSASAPATTKFEMQFGPGADNAGTRALESEDGVLKLDVHTLWPAQQELMVATAPKDHGVEKRLMWSVQGDGKELASGRFGAWILGKGDVDVALEGVKQLTLETRVELSSKPTIFWADARVVTADGREIPLSQLPLHYQNVLEPKSADRDYVGGPIKIVGTAYEHAVPGQPKDAKLPATVQVDLTGVNAARFKATIGGDYPLGDETQRRKTFASKIGGNSARFLTLIEPYENVAVVTSARATGADEIHVQLSDGRQQIIRLHGLEAGGDAISVQIEERKPGGADRSESTGK